MGQINSTTLPQYVPEAQSAGNKIKSNTDSVSTQTAEADVPQDDLQLTRLSGALNGLKKSATAIRSQISSVMASVRSGTYEVDSMQVSRSIVGESLASR